MVERIGRTVGETDMRDSSFGSAVTKFVYLSSIRQGKGVGTMLEAFRIACAEGLDASLDIYGPVRPDFDEELFEKYASESRINYRGQVNHDKVVELLNRYQCFIFPSEFDTEGFPAVLVEAFAAGLPVIASDAASNREIVIDGVNGIVYGAGKATELARAMRQMAENPDFMKQASARNLADAPRFEATRVVGDYRQALIEVGWAL
ncbi:MAG: glycosyltransferase family 4 protein [Ancrocorticia sp.]